MDDKMFYIGKVEKICHISKKTLRYYDKVGVLSPDKVEGDNGYRYYSKSNLLSIPVIKYYKQSGFKLEEIKKLRDEMACEGLEKSFNEKVDELDDTYKELKLKIKSVKDWHALIKEAKLVIDNDITDVSVKYINRKEMLFLDQTFKYDYKDSIINIEFTNFVEGLNNAITGPVIIEFPSFEEKMTGKANKMKIIQENILKSDDEYITEYGDCMVASCYHIGTHDDIKLTYEKIDKWIKERNYISEGACYERYVIDYWTSKDYKNFVTEVLVKLKNKKNIPL